ncbi:MAG: metal-dependent hydrolase [candidate division WWE3 bacterium]|nr:metal-dependent hydrolase [candidate division WWE3 bacterium]
MNKLRWLFGTFMVAAPDLASGVALSSLMMLLFAQPRIFLVLILNVVLGVFAAISPDLDLLIHVLVLKRPISFDHRLRFHKPILIVLVWLVIAPFSVFYATLVALCILAHFVDDSVGDAQEWGIQVFWPFSNKTVVFCSRKGGEFQLIRFYEPSQFAMPKHEDELDKYYLGLTIKNITTLTWGGVALLLLIVVFARL